MTEDHRKECDSCHEKFRFLHPLPFLYLDRNHPRRDERGYFHPKVCRDCYKLKTGEYPNAKDRKVKE